MFFTSHPIPRSVHSQCIIYTRTLFDVSYLLLYTLYVYAEREHTVERIKYIHEIEFFNGPFEINKKKSDRPRVIVTKHILSNPCRSVIGD